MKKSLLFIVVAVNVLIIFLALRWMMKGDFEEPLIVLVGQILSLINIFTNSGDASFKGIRGSNVKADLDGPGDFHLEDMSDSDLDVTKR